MKRKNSTLRIAQTGYKVSLLRVAPGEECVVGRQLAENIQKTTGSKPVCLIKVFGRFDLCAIYKTDDYEEGPSKAGPIPGIRGSNKILAFRWIPGDQTDPLSVEKAPGHVWALSFFRFNQSLVRKYGVRIETALARHWYNNRHRFPNVAFDILGTTGWAEALFILRGRRFNDVAEALDTISRQKVVTSQSPRTVKLVPTKTVSMIGINFDLIGRSEVHRLPTRLREKFEFGQGVFPVLHVTCPAGSMQKVYEYASTNIATKATPLYRIGPGSITFGVSDLIFSPHSGRWGDLLYTLIEMRESLKRHLYSTSLSVLRHPRDGQPPGKSPQESYLLPTQRPLDIRPHLTAMFEKWANYKGRLRNLYFGLSNLLQDPIIGQCFDDLRPFATRSLPYLLQKASPGDEFLPRLVNDAIDVLHYGAQERAHGAFLAIEHLEASLSPTKGGIQRILTAASVIPRSLFTRIKRRWTGFLVTGYYNEFFTAHYDIVNLPFEYLFHPEQWTGLFHEVGHAAIFDTNFFNLDSTKIAHALSSGLGAVPEEEYEKWQDLVYEVGADLFALYFCYGTDIDFYLKNVWPFILRGAASLSEAHFVRFFIVHQYSKYFLQGGHRRFPANAAATEDIIEFRQKLTDLPLTADVSGLSSREANQAGIYGFELLAPVIELYHYRFSRRLGPRDLSAELRSPNLLKAVNTILKGQVFTDKIDSPDTFVLALKRHEQELSIASRQAAMISLWHSAVTRKT